MDVTAPPVVTNPDPLIRFLHYKTVDVDRRFELSPYPVLTDDFSPVEYLTRGYWATRSTLRGTSTATRCSR
jgi:hypothetical protein